MCLNVFYAQEGRKVDSAFVLPYGIFSSHVGTSVPVLLHCCGSECVRDYRFYE